MKKQEQNDEKKPSIIKRLKQRKEQKEIEEFKNKTEKIKNRILFFIKKHLFS